MASAEMDKSSLEALIRYLEIGAAIFGVIVVVGVAGESFFGIRLLWNDWKLQRLQAVESEAQEGVIARLNNETARLQKDLAWRILTEEEKAEIVSKLKPFASQRIDIFTYLGDPEADGLGWQIHKVLKSAGLDPSTPSRR
jgi:hypothetical protein